MLQYAARMNRGFTKAVQYIYVFDVRAKCNSTERTLEALISMHLALT